MTPRDMRHARIDADRAMRALSIAFIAAGVITFLVLWVLA